MIPKGLNRAYLKNTQWMKEGSESITSSIVTMSWEF